MHNNKITISRYKRYIIIYEKIERGTPKKSYYYRYVNGYYKDYYIGYKNQYGHKIILIIELEFEKQKTPLIIKLIRKLILLLEKLERRFQ